MALLCRCELGTRRRLQSPSSCYLFRIQSSRMAIPETVSNHCPSRLSCASRLGTRRIQLQARIMLWSSTSAMQVSQGLRSTSALSTSIVGTPALIGLAAIAQTDLLRMYDKRGTVSSTLRAMGLDYKRLPTSCDPDYRHTLPISFRCPCWPACRQHENAHGRPEATTAAFRCGADVSLWDLQKNRARTYQNPG